MRIPVDPPPSTLADVIGRVMDLLGPSGVNDPTQILVGKQYRQEFGTNPAGLALFVPEPSGHIGAAITMGKAASIAHSCHVLVHGGAAVLSDLDRLRNAYSIGDRVIAALVRAAPGRITFGDYGDPQPDDPTVSGTYGADVTFSFSYQRDVWKDPQIEALPASPATAPPFWSPAHLPTPLPAPTPATGVHTTVATTPKE